jgi:hypothetical protein
MHLVCTFCTARLYNSECFNLCEHNKKKFNLFVCTKYRTKRLRYKFYVFCEKNLHRRTINVKEREKVIFLFCCEKKKFIESRERIKLNWFQFIQIRVRGENLDTTSEPTTHKSDRFFIERAIWVRVKRSSRKDNGAFLSIELST